MDWKFYQDILWDYSDNNESDDKNRFLNFFIYFNDFTKFIIFKIIFLFRILNCCWHYKFQLMFKTVLAW